MGGTFYESSVGVRINLKISSLLSRASHVGLSHANSCTCGYATFSITLLAWGDPVAKITAIMFTKRTFLAEESRAVH